jgi:hypothetical protein
MSLQDLRSDLSFVGDRLMNRLLKKRLENYPPIKPQTTMKEKLAKKLADKKNAKNENL